MHAIDFWKAVTVDRSDLLMDLVAVLSRESLRYCVIGGQGVNAYVEPLVSLDLDIVVATDALPNVETILGAAFELQRFPHSINISRRGSDLRVQIQTDPRYAGFLERAEPRGVLGLVLPVAAVDDVLRGKIWAALDETRRPSKRQKDLADISRLIEAYPDLRSQVPREVLDRLL